MIDLNSMLIGAVVLLTGQMSMFVFMEIWNRMWGGEE